MYAVVLLMARHHLTRKLPKWKNVIILYHFGLFKDDYYMYIYIIYGSPILGGSNKSELHWRSCWGDFVVTDKQCNF